MATIKTGRYVIVNVQQQTVATLPDPNDGTPVQSSVRDFETTAQVSTTIIHDGPANQDAYLL